MSGIRPGPGGPNPNERSRAVSDVVAFTIVFSIVIVSVGIVAGVGFTVLDDIRTGEQTVNAQRAVESLADNVGEIARGHATRRIGEIEVGASARLGESPGLDVSARRSASIDSSALFVGRSASIEVTVDDGSGSPELDIDPTVGSLQYVLGDRNRTIGIESGAVFSRFPSGSVMNDAPQFACRDRDGDGDSDYVVVSVVELRSGGTSGAAGGNVEVEAEEVSSRLLYANTDGTTSQDVTVTASSNFGSAWADGLADAGWDGSVGGTDTVGCTSVERVFVRKTVVEITLD